MKNVKRKGTAGENELAKLLRSKGIRAYRNDQIYKGGKDNPDVSAEVFDVPLHIEVKRVERLNVSEAVNQAVQDAAQGTLPVVAHRRNRESWLVTIPLLPLLEVLRTGEMNHDE